jgi:uncharacterized RDD family membrane protein YckC
MEAGTFTADRTTAVTSARAGFWRRFASAFIDGILLGVVSGILRAIFDQSAGGGLGLLITIGYFTYFQGSTGQTPGNAALSIRVVDKETGRPIGYGRAFVRWLVSIVSALVFFLGYLWMLWDSQKQCWHDKAANDVVVPAHD